jgi:hypothetical protein
MMQVKHEMNHKYKGTTYVGDIKGQCLVEIKVHLSIIS